MDCKQYLIEGKRERIVELYRSYRKRFLEDFLLGDCKIWAESQIFVTDEVAMRLLPLNRVKVGKGEAAIPARYEQFLLSDRNYRCRPD